MDAVRVEQVMAECWAAGWSEVREVLVGEVSALAGISVMRQMMKMLRKVCVAGFRSWLEQADCQDETIERDGRTLRYKLTSPKEFATPCGLMVVDRRLFQDDRGGPTVAVVDEAWGMVGEYATPEVREMAAFLLGLMTSQEAVAVLGKASLCQIGETSLKTIAGEFGAWVEAHPEILAAVRAAEEIPTETRVFCVSGDGSNIRLDEPGPKPGRPVAGDDGEPAPTCFKNAMIGTVSLYGAVPENEVTPTRLETRSLARMPEEGSPTFRRKFEEEVREKLAKCSPQVIHVAVIDGAKSLWTYLESNPLFNDFKKILDFHHAVEHLSTASDALFGKGTLAAKAWSIRHRHTLLDHDDGPQRIIRAIDYALNNRRCSQSARTEALKQRQFFQNNSTRMTYATFRAEGLPIGSGPVEAAGKTLVKTRMCRSGMRWSRQGGQEILNIRTLIKSDRWNPLWSRYLQTLQVA